MDYIELRKKIILDLRSIPSDIAYVKPGQPVPLGRHLERGKLGGLYYHRKPMGLTGRKMVIPEDKIYKPSELPATDMKKVESLASEIVTHAKRVEPKISNAMKQIEQQVGGQLAGIKYRLKSFNSARDKILRDCRDEPDLTPEAAAGKLADLVRYTLLFEPDDYCDKTKQSLDYLKESGYNLKKVKNFWKIGDGSYKGVNCQIEKDGQTFELQFHTPTTLDIKENKSHPLYDKFNRIQDEMGKKSIMEQIKSIWGEVPTPKGALAS